MPSIYALQRCCRCIANYTAVALDAFLVWPAVGLEQLARIIRILLLVSFQWRGHCLIMYATIWYHLCEYSPVAITRYSSKVD